MRLLLPAAVLLLALVLSAEAQEDTFMDRLGRLREHVTSSATTLLEKGKAVVEDISNSKYAVESRTWLQEQMERVANKFQELKN
ncbi:hypothetical protein D4764_0047300 [Takifugu flavidus]|uniref:Apolipoprotein C-I n=1 Tax=Takifugu flavidus TaxID=433684 RepID=A0A5C6ME59_9TELE|nr:hypothetical protein D4764_0047300 [Takifugu flavidus]